jgi:aspartyl-tRNA(Asn)/glutamyl-tRNA(Gln) amidotransferase subunit B
MTTSSQGDGELTGLLARWEPVIGLEVHVALASESKAFSPSAIRFGAPPNSLTDPTVLGLPGALPRFNRRALELALRLGLATRSQIRARSRFARKHYFYPDLPKGYQISQYDEPLCEHGVVELWLAGARREVRLQRIHLEEDAGKNSHHGATSLVDLNRAGVPLVEVVTAPDLRSADEAAEYMRSLHRLVRWLGVSEGDMEKGQLRCDANVSVRPRGADAYGTRTELKNINSFRFVHRAIEHEIVRQIRILEAGGAVERETRLWDANAGRSESMRSKEEVSDYRYFPDPDLPPLVVDEAMKAAIAAELPELPAARLERFMNAYGLAFDDAHHLTSERELGDYLDAAVAVRGDATLARGLAAWIAGELTALLAGRPITASPIAADALAELVGLIHDGTISGKQGKDVFAAMASGGERPAAIVERLGMKQISDEGALLAVAEKIVADNAKQVALYRAGKEGLLGFFVGQLLKATGGQANPQLASALMKRLLAS